MSLGWWTVALLALVAGTPEGTDSAAAVARAREALRTRLGVADTRIHMVDAAPTSWNDTSLGCPEKGQAYQPVVTQGHVVHLRVDDRTYDVRVAGDRVLVCEAAESAAAQAVAAARVSRLARRELAARLKLSEADVHVELVRPRTWPDAALGCGTPDAAAAPGAGVRGFLIELTAGGRPYEYHADTDRVVSCDPATARTPAP
jgi:hypothetical protein